MYVEPCEGDSSWVEDAILKAKKCIEGDIPDPGQGCDYCRWYYAQKK